MFTSETLQEVSCTLVFHEPHLQAVHAKLKTNEARRLKMQPRNMQALIKMALEFGIEKNHKRN